MPDLAELRASFQSNEPPRSLFPLFWLHGDRRETEEVIRREIAKMDEGGCGGFVIESRPHNDYLGERWWDDLEICLNEAEKRNIDVWIFDEEYYPSGIAGGQVLTENPDYRMQVLVKQSFHWNTDHPEMIFDEQISEWDDVLKIACYPNQPGESTLNRGSAVTLLSIEELQVWQKQNKQNHSQQSWQIIIIGLKKSWSGRMVEKMVDYLCPEITDCFINLTYEATKKRFGSYFGKTLKGFFGDETSFENFASYDVLFGEDVPCMPWTRVLLEDFAAEKGYNLIDYVEALWFDIGEITNNVRFDFMDRMTQLFSQNFFKRIQTWCHDNGVQFIGHVIEDNEAHMHHGYGPGHFFRTTKHFDMGGYDIVLRQVDREQNKIPYEDNYPQFSWDSDFFQFTLGKLAQSAAHLELKTDLVMCENFGAYGWDLGLRDMKWLTDWQTARGTNWYVPHAFSPLFPDPDCPPHFFAAGANPQWKFFRKWANYANRSCMMLQKAVHVSSVAVLYPAESHWSGDQDQLDQVCKCLMENQVDFDILSFDLLAQVEKCVLEQGRFKVGKEEFTTIILPGIETLPLASMKRLKEFVKSGGKLIAVEKMVSKECSGKHKMVKEIMGQIEGKVIKTTLSGLSSKFADWRNRSIKVTPKFSDLRFCHYRKDDIEIFFLNNESSDKSFKGAVKFTVDGIPELWEPMNGKIMKVPVYRHDNGKTEVSIELELYQSIFCVFIPEPSKEKSDSELDDSIPHHWLKVFQDNNEQLKETNLELKQPINLDEWTIKNIQPAFNKVTIPNITEMGLGDWHSFKGWGAFSGTVTYETHFHLKKKVNKNSHFVLDLGQVGEIAVVKLNGSVVDTCICPPYRVEICEALSTRNVIQVEVTNTLGASIRDHFKRKKPFPSGLIGPVQLKNGTKRYISENIQK
jgi:hypothetical protein